MGEGKTRLLQELQGQITGLNARLEAIEGEKESIRLELAELRECRRLLTGQPSIQEEPERRSGDVEAIMGQANAGIGQAGAVLLTPEERVLHAKTMLVSAGREESGSMIRQILEYPNHRRDMYRSALAKSHPDRHGGDQTKLREVEAAYSALQRDDAERSRR